MQVEWVLDWREEKDLFMETNLWLSIESTQVQPCINENLTLTRK